MAIIFVGLFIFIFITFSPERTYKVFWIRDRFLIKYLIVNNKRIGSPFVLVLTWQDNAVRARSVVLREWGEVSFPACKEEGISCPPFRPFIPVLSYVNKISSGDRYPPSLLVLAF